jgi:hypothetical protein
MERSRHVYKIASAVREIAEEVSVEIVKGPGWFPQSPFPSGWCQDTSRALGKLLKDRGEVGFMLVFGRRPYDHRKTHVWLERAGVIVDITADQFSREISSPIIVTTDRSWHAGWEHKEQELDDVIASQADGALYWAIKNHPAWCSASI